MALQVSTEALVDVTGRLLAPTAPSLATTVTPTDRYFAPTDPPPPVGLTSKRRRPAAVATGRRNLLIRHILFRTEAADPPATSS